LDGSGIPQSITAIDQVENRLVTEFREGRFIPEEEEIFEFDYPLEAEIIDLRPGS
jgi:outer membrane lipoprotein-sorting protein